MELEKLLPKWNCPRCGDWFHMPYKFCACNTRRPQSEQKIMYVGKVGRKMNILNELERLSKEATPGDWMPCGDILRNVAAIRTQSEDLFCSYGPMTMRAADNAELIATMRNNIEALIEAARCLEHVVGFCHLTHDGSTHKWATDILEKLK